MASKNRQLESQAKPASIEAAAAPPVVEDRNRVSFVVLLGGTGGMVGDRIRDQAPELRDSMVEIDTAASRESDEDRFTLTGDGRENDFVAYRANYSLIKDDPLVAQLTRDAMAATGHGVGKYRLLTMILLAAHLDRLKTWLFRKISTVLLGLRGPCAPKTVVVDVVASGAGGTGSSLAVPTAILVRDLIRSIDPTLVVKVKLHLATPACFAAGANSPGEARRNQANAAATMLEIAHCQMPSRREALHEALRTGRPQGRLFDAVNLYDVADSGCRPLDLDQIAERITANIRGVQDKEVGDLEDQFDVNRVVDVMGSRDRPECHVLESSQAAIVEFRREPTGRRYAAAEVEALLGGVLRPADPRRAERLRAAHGKRLSIEQVKQRIGAAIEHHAEGARLDLGAVAQAAPSGAYERFNGETLPRVEKTRETLAKKLRREIVPRVTYDCLRDVLSEAQGLPETRAVVELLRLAVVEESRRQRAKLEALAQNEVAGAFNAARTRAQSVFFNKRRAAKRAGEAFNALVAVELARHRRETVLLDFLEPMAALLGNLVVGVELIVDRLTHWMACYRACGAELDAALTRQGAFLAGVVEPDEYLNFMRRLAANIAAEGDAPGLSLERLIETDGAEAGIARILSEVERDRVERFDRHVAGLAGLSGLVEAYRLRFQPREWLTETMRALTLPSRLNTAIEGSGQAPEQTIVAADGRDAIVARAVVDGRRDSSGIALVGSDAPFRLVVRKRISGLVFEAVPNWVDLMGAWAEFVESGRGGELLSSGLLAGAETDPLATEFKDRNPSFSTWSSLPAGDRNGNHQLATAPNSRL